MVLGLKNGKMQIKWEVTLSKKIFDYDVNTFLLQYIPRYRSGLNFMKIMLTMLKLDKNYERSSNN